MNVEKHKVHCLYDQIYFLIIQNLRKILTYKNMGYFKPQRLIFKYFYSQKNRKLYILASLIVICEFCI